MKSIAEELIVHGKSDGHIMNGRREVCLVGAAALACGLQLQPYMNPTSETWDSLPEEVRHALLIAAVPPDEVNEALRAVRALYARTDWGTVTQFSDTRDYDDVLRAAKHADELLSDYNGPS